MRTPRTTSPHQARTNPAKANKPVSKAATVKTLMGKAEPLLRMKDGKEVIKGSDLLKILDLATSAGAYNKAVKGGCTAAQAKAVAALAVDVVKQDKYRFLRVPIPGATRDPKKLFAMPTARLQWHIETAYGDGHSVQFSPPCSPGQPKRKGAGDAFEKAREEAYDFGIVDGQDLAQTFFNYGGEAVKPGIATTWANARARGSATGQSVEAEINDVLAKAKTTPDKFSAQFWAQSRATEEKALRIARKLLARGSEMASKKTKTK